MIDVNEVGAFPSIIDGGDAVAMVDFATAHPCPGCPGRPGPVFGCPGRVRALSGLCPGLAGAPLIAARNVSNWGGLAPIGIKIGRARRRGLFAS